MLTSAREAGRCICLQFRGGRAMRRRILALASTLTLIGYSHVVAAPAEIPSTSSPLLDDRYIEVARHFPGFAGAVVVDGRLDIRTTSRPAPDSAFRAAVIEALDDSSLTNLETTYTQVRYDFPTLKDWQTAVDSFVWRSNSAVFTDSDEMKNRVVVGVADLTVSEAIRSEAESRGIPADALAIVTAPKQTPQSSLRNAHRPIVAGLQIQYSNGTVGRTCTMGFLATRAGVSGFVTNSHCTNSQGGVEATPYGQATCPIQNCATSTSFVGSEIADPYYTSLPGCPLTELCRYSDSAFVAKSLSVLSEQGKIAWPAQNTCTPEPGDCPWNGTSKFRIVNTAGLAMGQTLYKVGRSTGLRSGGVTSTCANVRQSTSIGGYIFLCQGRITWNLIAEGDSGSPVFACCSGGDVTLKGLAWGTETFSPIGQVTRAEELGPMSVCWSGC